MIIIAGHVEVEPDQRESYLEKSVEVVEKARVAPGCLGFAMSADIVESGRILIYERWDSRESVEAFRGDGPSDEQSSSMLSVEVYEYEVSSERSLF